MKKLFILSLSHTELERKDFVLSNSLGTYKLHFYRFQSPHGLRFITQMVCLGICNYKAQRVLVITRVQLFY